MNNAQKTRDPQSYRPATDIERPSERCTTCTCATCENTTCQPGYTRTRTLTSVAIWGASWPEGSQKTRAHRATASLSETCCWQNSQNHRNNRKSQPQPRRWLEEGNHFGCQRAGGRKTFVPAQHKTNGAAFGRGDRNSVCPSCEPHTADGTAFKSRSVAPLWLPPRASSKPKHCHAGNSLRWLFSHCAAFTIATNARVTEIDEHWESGALARDWTPDWENSNKSTCKRSSAECSAAASGRTGRRIASSHRKKGDRVEPPRPGAAACSQYDSRTQVTEGCRDERELWRPTENDQPIHTVWQRSMVGLRLNSHHVFSR